MGGQEFCRGGAFAGVVLVLVVVLAPFGIEQIGEATGLFSFPATKTIKGCFANPAAPAGSAAVHPVDWERYRKDLETFTWWAEAQKIPDIVPPREPVVVPEDEPRLPKIRIWPVSVAGCTAGAPGRRGYAYVRIGAAEKRFFEGDRIAPSPSDNLCGYEIVCIGDRTVWLRVVTTDEGDATMGGVRLPEFTRVERESLVLGNRKYVVGHQFPLASGGCLKIDSFLLPNEPFGPPDGVVFKILDESGGEVTSLLCVVIDEKGGR